MINPLYYFYKINPSLKKIIKDNFSFYRKLSNYDKIKFEYRVSRFIKTHNFIGKNGIEITPVKKIVVASVAVMLTFKISNYLYAQFKNIIIYPKDYLSRITKQMHKGETNPEAKTIVLSWKGLVEGIKVQDDNLNLGIHEFAHALYFSFLTQNNEEAKNFISNFKNILDYLNTKNDKIRNSNYFREYAFVNKHEFLAVITENYFETPSEFHTKLPELFVMVNKMYKSY